MRRNGNLARTTAVAPNACFHGGAFFSAIGERFDALERRNAIVNADVLDAWFPPAPAVLAELTNHLEWLARTSPPTHCRGLQEAIAEARGIPGESVLVGAGSSDLIFLALREWLSAKSRVLVLDPCYGEYTHVLENVIGCEVERFVLRRAEGWAPDLERLGARLQRGGFDAFIVVNPNNPTGHYVPRAAMEALLARAPSNTLVWIDEAYLEYVASGASLESVAVRSPNVVVCKSLSKVYALSGMRAAYLAGPPSRVGPLRTITPPWAVSLPAQVAAVRALESEAYYQGRWRETSVLRARLRGMLLRVHGVEEVTGNANYLLVHLDPHGVPARDVIEQARAQGVCLRDVTSMGSGFDAFVLRTAVKNTSRNSVIVGTIARALGTHVTMAGATNGWQLSGRVRPVG